MKKIVVLGLILSITSATVCADKDKGGGISSVWKAFKEETQEGGRSNAALLWEIKEKFYDNMTEPTHGSRIEKAQQRVDAAKAVVKTTDLLSSKLYILNSALFAGNLAFLGVICGVTKRPSLRAFGGLYCGLGSLSGYIQYPVMTQDLHNRAKDELKEAHRQLDWQERKNQPK